MTGSSKLSLLSAVFSYVLVAVSFFMFSWGALGFLEYFYGLAPLTPLQNPVFPSGTQFLHWFTIFTSGAVFLIGYFSRWEYTPHAMVISYTALATLCFVETFDFLTNPNRYIAMVVEYITYVVISMYLFQSQRMRNHFGNRNTPTEY